MSKQQQTPKSKTKSKPTAKTTNKKKQSQQTQGPKPKHPSSLNRSRRPRNRSRNQDAFNGRDNRNKKHSGGRRHPKESAIRAKQEEQCYPPEARGAYSALLPAPCCRYLATVADPTLDMLHAAPYPGAYPPPGDVGLIRLKLRGQFVSSTNGVGWIAFCPGLAGPYFDRLPICGTSIGNTSVDLNPTLGGLQQIYWPDAPFDSIGTEPNGDDMSYRCVGAVLRMRNVTKQVGREGVLTLTEVPLHTYEGANGMTYNSVASTPRATSYTLSDAEGGWYEATWHAPGTQMNVDSAGDDEEAHALGGMEFAAFNESNNLITPQASMLSEIIACWSTPTVVAGGTQQTFEVEAYAIYECRGNRVLDKTNYLRDDDAATMSTNALTEIGSRVGADYADHNSTASKIKDYIQVAADLAEQIVPIGMNAMALLA